MEGMIRMMNDSNDFIGPMNLGNPSEFTIKQLAEIVLEMTDSKSKLVYEPLPADDPVRRCPDITLAKKHLNWTPQVPLRKGLSATIDWFRSVDLQQFRPPTPNY